MNGKGNVTKKPMSRNTIYKIMLVVTYVVAGVFLVKNIISGSTGAMLAIAMCLVVFTAVLVGMRVLKKEMKQQQYAVCISIIFLVFVISLFSGNYYSDDFGLYIAIVALSGMYLRPKYTMTQIILADIMLTLQYIINPEKADPLGQYIMCMAIFTLGGVMFYLVIKRGRAYIEIGVKRAEEAEKLLDSLEQLGEELDRNVENSSSSMETFKVTNERLNRDAEELKRGSASIVRGAQEVADTCDDVRSKMVQTEKQVDALTQGVHNFEDSLALNRKNMGEMDSQMKSVQTTMNQANEVFRLLEEQMKEISAVTEELNSISNSTTMLALNASIEAARAGQSGAGFAVVASKVQDLAVDSTKCSGQVASVVNVMQGQIQATTKQLAESGQAIITSLAVLQGLQEGFDQLTENFDELYQSIEAQNGNITQVNMIFEQLKSDIADMSQCSEENQEAVEDIAEAMSIYKDNMDRMMDDTRQVRELSSNLLTVAQQDEIEE